MHNGRLVVHQLTCDPSQVGRVLRAREPDLGDITRGRWTFGYHRTDDGVLRMLEIDPPVGDLLLAVDGRSSLDGIAGRLFGTGTATGRLLPAFTELTALGLLVWRLDGKTAPCA
jgi:hypothetical protein